MKNYKEYIDLIENYLFQTIPIQSEYREKLFESMKYSITSGGKRIRPLLTLFTYEMFRDDLERVVPYGCAVELIHTYSLIHDDLPCMDNDDFRRGKPTNHKVFGEAVAVLAGDSLLNLAAEVLTKEISNYDNLDDIKKGVQAMKIIFGSSGSKGMAGGQAIDILYDESQYNEDILESMYKLKTGELIKASILSGAVLGGASAEQYQKLLEFAYSLGLIYQLQDDVLDMEKDKEMGKITLLNYLKEDPEEYIEKKTAEAIDNLKSLELNSGMLEDFVTGLLNRSY